MVKNAIELQGLARRENLNWLVMQLLGFRSHARRHAYTFVTDYLACRRRFSHWATG